MHWHTLKEIKQITDLRKLGILLRASACRARKQCNRRPKNWRKLRFWNYLCSYHVFLHFNIDFFTWSVWPWNYKQIIDVRQCKLAPSAAVIGKNVIGESCQILTRTKLLTDKSWPEKYLPDENQWTVQHL